MALLNEPRQLASRLWDIDEIMIRQPVGVAAAIVPLNFSGMIAFWFLPYALACCNTYIVEPSEKVRGLLSAEGPWTGSTPHGT